MATKYESDEQAEEQDGPMIEGFGEGFAEFFEEATARGGDWWKPKVGEKVLVKLDKVETIDTPESKYATTQDVMRLSKLDPQTGRYLGPLSVNRIHLLQWKAAQINDVNPDGIEVLYSLEYLGKVPHVTVDGKMGEAHDFNVRAMSRHPRGGWGVWVNVGPDGLHQLMTLKEERAHWDSIKSEKAAAEKKGKAKK